MASYTRNSRSAYSPSAPPVPDPADEPQLAHPYNPHHATPTSTATPPPPNYSRTPPYNPPQTTTTTTQQGHGYGYGYGSGQQPYGYYQHPAPQPSQYGSLFPPGTDSEVIRSFEMVDRDRSGSIEEKELQQALTSAYQKFSLRTIRLLIFLFNTDPSRHSSSSIGPKEFAALWSCLGQWRAIFERFDRDRSGKIDSAELRDAFYSIGYAIPPSVLQVLISRYDDGSGRRVELGFDTFIECGMIVKGLTEKFKEKDRHYTGSATLAYEEFMSMIIPFLAAD